MTKFSDDGLWYWDGAQWLSAISADGAWKWTEAGWAANARPKVASRWPRIWRIGSWVAAGLAVLLLVLCIAGFVGFISEQSQGNPGALGTLGAVLVIVSFAVLLASPAALRQARRRGLFLGASITAAILFVGSCGGGVALVTAFPQPSPTSIAQRPTSSPTTSPELTQTPSAVALLPTPFPTPSESPPPSPSPSPSPSAAPRPSPVAVPSPKPKPTPRRSPAPVVNLCGAPSNPWHYNFCGRGGPIYSPAGSFCAYFYPCVSTFWTATRVYVVRCASGKWSHSGGVSGACSSNGGVSRILYSGP